MQPSTLVFICLCGSRALRPTTVATQRRRCSQSATPRGFGSTPTKTKKQAKREGLFRVELRRAAGVGTARDGASAAAVGWDEVDAHAGDADRGSVAGVAGAFLLHNVAHAEGVRPPRGARPMKPASEEAPRDERRDQQNGAVSRTWLEPVFQRCSHLLPESVLAYAAARRRRTTRPRPPERSGDGARPRPGRLCELSGLNPRLRVYRYRADSTVSAHASAWPGSTQHHHWLKRKELGLRPMDRRPEGLPAEA